MKIALVTFLCLAFTACSPSRPPQTRSEITGTQQERVARATSILSEYCRLPSPLLDAHMAEDIHDNSGGMVTGPSDSWLSGVILIPAADLPKWREALSPVVIPSPAPTFASPIAPPTWWPLPAVFEGCEFYTPKKLIGRSGGFVALSPSTSRIFFSTYNH